MIYLFFSIAIALIDWIAVATNKQKIEYLAKPGTMVFLILWLITQMPPEPNGLSYFILAGLVFSLIGDIFLMLPQKWFIAGLVAFLLAQLAYIGGFNSDGITLPWNSIIPALIITLIAIPLYLRIRSGLVAGGNQKLVVPVTVYVIIIATMAFSAITTLFKADWSLKAGILVSAGAALFFTSDAILAWNRFVSPIPQGRSLNMIPYHIAQFLITAGTLVKLGSL